MFHEICLIFLFDFSFQHQHGIIQHPKYTMTERDTWRKMASWCWNWQMIRCLWHWLMASMVPELGRFDVCLDAVEEKKTDHVSGRLLDYDRYMSYLGDVCFIQGNTTCSGELFTTSHQIFHRTWFFLNQPWLKRVSMIIPSLKHETYLWVASQVSDYCSGHISVLQHHMNSVLFSGCRKIEKVETPQRHIKPQA